MIFGHLGVIGALRSVTRKPEGTAALLALAVAGYLPDFVDLTYVLVGFCSPYGLYSHTLPALALETAVVAALTWLITGSVPTTLLFTVAVLLHFPPDMVTGHKLVMPGGELFGLDYYERPLLNEFIELPLMIAGWWVLRRSGNGPRWARHGATLAIAVTFQLLFSAYAARFQVKKPNACLVGKSAYLLRAPTH